MRKRHLSAAAFLLSSAALVALPKVAVLDLSAQNGVDPSVVVPITESIMEEVVASKGYIVLDRAYIEQVLKEKEFQLSSLVSDTQATAAGQYLGADFVVAGRIQLMGDSHFLVAKMIEVKTGVIAAQASEQGEGKPAALLLMAKSLGRKLVGAAPTPSAPPAPGGPAGTPAPSAALAKGSAAERALPAGARLKAGFILRGKLEDGPWTQAQALAVARLKERNAAWLEVLVAEQVEPPDLAAAVKRLARTEGCAVIFGTSMEYCDDLVRLAREYPTVVFESFGGSWIPDLPPNFGTFGIGEEGMYYLMGLVAGALTEKGKIGYLALSPKDDDFATLLANLFALGVKAGNPRAQVLIRFLPPRHWETEGLSRAAVEALVAEGCDFLGGQDEPEVFRAAEAATQRGKRIRLFQRDFPHTVSPNVLVSGPLRDFTVPYERALAALRDGSWKREDFFSGTWDGGIKFGGGGPPFNPVFLPELRGKRVKTPDLGERPLLELIEIRVDQLRREEWKILTGPVKDQKGRVRIPAGVRLETWDMPGRDWLVDNVKGSIPAK